jgi:hypothetical protein
MKTPQASISEKYKHQLDICLLVLPVDTMQFHNLPHGNTMFMVYPDNLQEQRKLSHKNSTYWSLWNNVVCSMVRFQVVTEASMKMTVFWDDVPCSLVEVYRHFRGAYRLHHQGDYSDDGGSKHCWNVGKLLLPDYMCNIPEDSCLH